MKKNELINTQMSFDEYVEKYSAKRKEKTVKSFLFLGISIVGIIIVVALALLCVRMYEINDIACYVTIGLSVLAFLFFYLIPVIRVYKVRYFITSVDDEISGAKAKRHNRNVREQIADDMINLAESVKEIEWYDKVRIGELAIARNRHDDKALIEKLKEIYRIDIKKQSKKIITERALQIGLITAASPNENLDAAVIVVLELKLIKDLVYLYGFRPSDRQLSKIYRTVIIGTLISYGVAATFNKVSFTIATGISLLNTVLGNLIASASQGIVNGVMTVVLGEQVRAALLKEFRLQEVLDGFEFEDDVEEQEEMIKEVKKEIARPKKHKNEVATSN